MSRLLTNVKLKMSSKVVLLCGTLVLVFLAAEAKLKGDDCEGILYMIIINVPFQ